MKKNSTLRNESRSTQVKSIGKAVNVLKAITCDLKKLSDISRQVNLSKSTVHRLVQTLRECGLVHQDPLTREYFPGPVLFTLTSNPINAHQHLIYRAYGKMDYLRSKTGETVSLDIKLGMEKVKLLQLLGTHNILVMGVPPNYSVIWTGSMGKVLLAQLPEAEFELILDNVEFYPITPRTITDKNVFRQEIAKVRQRGYATTFGETDPSVAGVTAPVFNYCVPASISIIGPLERLSSHIADYTEELTRKAAEISKELLEKTAGAV